MLAVIGLDIAKRYFQLHSVDPATGEITKLHLECQHVATAPCRARNQ